ncbi:MAG: peptidase [Gammaproteobacteria bacterium]|nr:peptidase [Gammaproteobacteria bacterium]
MKAQTLLPTLLLSLLAAEACCAPVLSQAATLPDAPLVTVAEQSKFIRTGRYDEVQRLCKAYADAWRDAVKCTEFGRTPEGRPMIALIASRSGVLAPDEARRRNLPVMLLQGGIHAGEIDGKDAGFLALRELLADTVAPGALKTFVLVFVPVFNIDGHERVGRWNRPNQVGPEEMGWRATGQNLNLNRDYMKADAPEMHAMLRLLNAWDPVLYVDMHVTDGANFQHDVSNTVDPLYSGDPQLHPIARALVAELNSKIAAMGSHPLDFYPDFVREDDPASGFALNVYSPRFSTAYWSLHNRFGLLVETHSWKDYATRVRVTRNVIVNLADMMAKEGSHWREQTREADGRAQALGGQTVALGFENGPHVTTIDFLGYAYTREPSAISGSLATHYDPTKPEVWHIPLRDSVVAKASIQAPRGGYIVTAANAGWLAEKLSLHGVRFEKLIKPANDAQVETFRATKVTYSQATFEGHTMLAFEGAWGQEHRTLAAGSLFVPIAQANARVAVALLEPQAEDSLAAWGFFNTAFEAKEYMEPYVAEQVAADLLAHDAQVAAAFKKRLADDPQFAASPSARLEFFYRRHPSWDERLNLYPVYRVAAAP